MIYLDNAATTKPSNVVIESLQKFMQTDYFNPSAMYFPAINVNEKIEAVKKQIAKILGVKYLDNIIFTGSATEANNIALLGQIKKNTHHIVTSEGEHPSVYNTLNQLSQEIKVDFVPLQSNGEIDYKIFEQTINNDSNIISIMLVNNETGAINNLKLVDELRKKICPNASLHVDCSQAFNKVDFLATDFDADFITISAHKIGGPKGLGILYAKSLKKLKSIVFGGGQEYGLRSGTQNAPGILAFGELLNLYNPTSYNEKAQKLKAKFLDIIRDSPIKCNSGNNCSPFILSLTFPNVKGETMLHALEQKNVIVGTGSACSSKKSGNRILNSMGYSSESIVSSIRVSFGFETTIEETETAAKIIVETYNDLRLKTGVK